MTDDTSPENLRKFLESDDPGLRMMGLSMAKGSGVPEELYKNVFGLSLWDPEEGNREAAAELVEEIGLENITEFPGWLEPPLEVLSDENYDVRHRAVEALGEIGDGRAVEPLIGALRDEECRMAATEALEKIGEPAVEPLIRVLSGDDLGVRRAAAMVLRFGDTRAVEPLIKALGDEDQYVRDSAMEALEKIGDERAVEPLIGMLSDDDREAAAYALGKIGDVRAVEPLIGMLSDDGREAAVVALDELGWVPETDGQRAAYLIAGKDWESLVEWGGPAVEPLIVLLGDDYNVQAAVKALGEIGEPAVEPLIEALRGDSWVVCKYAAEALGKIGDERAVEPLIRVLSGDDSGVRRYAAEALGEIGDGGAVEPLIKALGDEDVYLRKSTSTALGNIGDARAVEPLINALRTPLDRKYWTSGLCKDVTLALGKIGDLRAVEPLIEMLKDKEKREIAAKALGMLGDVRAVKPLISLLVRAKGTMKLAAAAALGKLGDERAVVSLIKLLNKTTREEEDIQTREIIAEALGEIGDERAVEPLIYLLSDKQNPESTNRERHWVSDKKKREAAAEALGKIGSARAVEGLFELLKNDDEAREVAMEVIIQIGEPVVEPLIGIIEDTSSRLGIQSGYTLEGEQEKRRRESAMEALGTIGDTRAVEPLINALEEGNTAHYIAAKALGEIGDTRAVEPLINVLGDGKGYACKFAAEALGEIGDERAVEPLIGVLSGNAWVRYVATALDKLGWVPETDEQRSAYLIAVDDWESLVEWGAPAVEPLIEALRWDDDQRWGQETATRAAEALGWTGDARAVEPLIEALERDNSAAAEALGMIGELAVEPLIKALEGGNSNAANALSELGWKPKTDELRVAYLLAKGDTEAFVKWGKSAVEPLIKALERGNPVAAEALGMLGDVRAVKPLIKALGNDFDNVRKAAVAALDVLGWEPDTEPFQLERLLASSGLRFSDVPIEGQEGLAEHCKLLLSHEKILDLEQEEFAKIAEERNSLLETMENSCTAGELIELLAGASSQIRWMTACAVVEICCFDGSTINKIYGSKINIFWSRISAYSNPITKADRDEIVRVMRGLPLVLSLHIAKRLHNAAIELKITGAMDKKASAVMKKNREIITTIFEDPALAKAILGGM